MKKLAAVLAGAALVTLVAASPAQASIVPYDNGNGGYYLLDDPLGDPGAEAAWIASVTGDADTYLNKYNWPDGWANGGAVTSTSPHFTVGSTTKGPSQNISWNLTGTGYGATYVLIKDGTVQGDPRGMLYRLYVVSADQFLIGSGTVAFPPAYDKDISHVSWFGATTGVPDRVPDGGMTLMLLGGALAGLAALRRRFSA